VSIDPWPEPAIPSARILAVSTLNPYGRTYTLWYSAPARIRRGRPEGLVAGRSQRVSWIETRVPGVKGLESGKPGEAVRRAGPNRTPHDPQSIRAIGNRRRTRRPPTIRFRLEPGPASGVSRSLVVGLPGRTASIRIRHGISNPGGFLVGWYRLSGQHRPSVG
jgi:hypothetical protein